MTTASTISIFMALAFLAAIPGPAIFTVVSRSMASGLFQGLATVTGIVFGDYIFITLSVYGMSYISIKLGGLFVIAKYAGSTYLIFIGSKLFFEKETTTEIQPVTNLSFISNFITGLSTTISNPKAILFYASLFPALVNIQNLTIIDVFMLIGVATISVGSVMTCYAYAAHKACGFIKNTRANKLLNATAGSIMICSGLFIATKS